MHLLGLEISEDLVLLLQLVHLLTEVWTVRLDCDCQFCDGCRLCFLVACKYFLIPCCISTNGIHFWAQIAFSNYLQSS